MENINDIKTACGDLACTNRGIVDAWMRNTVESWNRGFVDAWMRNTVESWNRGFVDAKRQGNISGLRKTAKQKNQKQC